MTYPVPAGVVRLTDPATGTARFRVKTVGDYHIEVISMAFNWRVHTVLVDGFPWTWSARFWCYQGRGRDSFLAAVLAAQAWDGGNDTEPAGWVKSWDGRYAGRLARHR